MPVLEKSQNNSTQPYGYTYVLEDMLWEGFTPWLFTHTSAVLSVMIIQQSNQSIPSHIHTVLTDILLTLFWLICFLKNWIGLKINNEIRCTGTQKPVLKSAARLMIMIMLFQVNLLVCINSLMVKWWMIKLNLLLLIMYYPSFKSSLFHNWFICLHQ